MRKLTLFLAAIAISQGAFADDCCNKKPECLRKPSTCMKKKPPECQPVCEKEFAWGIGLVGLAVIGVVAGISASCASGGSN